MARGIAAFMLALGLAACAAPHTIVDRSDYLAEGTRTYTGVSREQVISAAETVLKMSDPQDWEFRQEAHGFTGLRRYMVYLILATQQGREKWEFSTEQQGAKIVQASVTISEAGLATGGYTVTPYEGQMAAIPLYRLFWSRVDYMLGRRSDWVTCEQAVAELRETRTAAAALGGLCGSTSQGRDAPPPPPLVMAHA